MGRYLANKVLKLRSDNVTPLKRTPWAGSDIHRSYKAHLKPAVVQERIGESWEFSCDPDFPSLLEDGTALVDFIKENPHDVLGPQASDGDQVCEILVKLINASEPLSVQVHPSDGDAYLTSSECGKPESWYVLSAEPGSGFYIGFRKPLSREALRAALLDADKAKDLLHFVPVKAGDYFELEPGVPHAIGPGVTLLEPQRIVFGKSGKTYRMWDWGRRYNESGQVDQINGKPRALHVEEGLRLVDPERQVGDEFVDSVRRKPVITTIAPDVILESFPANPYYRLQILKALSVATLTVTTESTYAVVLTLDGAATFEGGVTLLKGEAALLPFAAGKQRFSLGAGAVVAFVHPSQGHLKF